MSKRSIVFAAMALVVAAAIPGMSVPRGGGSNFAAVQSAADWDQVQGRVEAHLARWRARAEERLARLRERQTRVLEEKLAKLDSDWAQQHERVAEQTAREHARWAQRMAQEQARWAKEHARWIERVGDFEFGELPQEPLLLLEDEDNGWLGVTVEEITGEKAKELKLSAERGVYIREVSTESPAAKAGLKAGDVITEFNGQRVEGTAQFRRLVRETPAGRAVQFTVWRDGRSQTISAQLGSPRERVMRSFKVRPPEFDFRFEMPKIETFATGRTPMLGIQADDLSGQLGSYFGAPDGEGVLVREVHSGSPAEKAGLKAGDVIFKVDGERVRTTSELRDQLREKREKKSASITVLRKGSEMSFNVEIEQPQPRRPARIVSRRTSL